MIQISLTPDKYLACLNKLAQAKAPDVESFTMPTATEPGQLVNSSVSLSFEYDQHNLNVTVVSKHGLAKFASDSTIKSHLIDLLDKA